MLQFENVVKSMSQEEANCKKKEVPLFNAEETLQSKTWWGEREPENSVGLKVYN